MARKRRKSSSNKLLEERIRETEKLWQEIKTAEGIVEKPEADVAKVKPIELHPEIRKEKEIHLGLNVYICLPNIKGLRAERKVEADFYSLNLLRDDRRLSVRLEVDREAKEVSIGGKDYRIKRDKLIELAPWSRWDIVRRETIREFPIERKGENIIIDLEKIGENDELRQFLTK